MSYEKLLEVFWDSHDPRFQPLWGRQYRNAVFYLDDEQRRIALDSRDGLARGLGVKIETDIRAAGTFYPAEDYHQKYELRADRALMREFEAMYPDPHDFAASTAAARVNGYLEGHGTRAAFEADLPRLGLSAAGQERLRSLAHRAP